jgi:acyl carrier protein
MAALSLDDFRALVAEIAKADLAAVTPDTRLVEDLDLDSLRMVELMAALAERGVPVPEDIALDGGTVRRAYESCRVVLAWPRSVSG